MPNLAEHDVYVDHPAGYGKVLIARAGQPLTEAQQILVEDAKEKAKAPTEQTKSPADEKAAKDSASKKSGG